MLKLDPQAATINGVGGSTQVAVTAEMADGIISARFTLSFDPSLVEATTIKTSGAGYLFTDAGANVIPGETTIDNTNGNSYCGRPGAETGIHRCGWRRDSCHNHICLKAVRHREYRIRAG